jgi:hypothetical protein
MTHGVTVRANLDGLVAGVGVGRSFLSVGTSLLLLVKLGSVVLSLFDGAALLLVLLFILLILFVRSISIWSALRVS